MSKSTMLPSEAVRRLVRLVRETDEVSRDWRQRADHAARGLSALVHAQVGLVMKFRDYHRGRQPVMTDGVEAGWFDDGARSAFLAYLDEGDHAADPFLAAINNNDRLVITSDRPRFVSDRQWYGSVHVNEYRRVARLDHCIYTFRRQEPGSDQAVGMGLHRPWGDREFSARDVELIDIFHREAGDLLQPPPDWRRELMRQLPPRLRQVLRRLLAGDSEKQVAYRLGLSANTVHGYVKKLHKRLDVSSRGELLSLFLENNDQVPDGQQAL